MKKKLPHRLAAALCALAMALALTPSALAADSFNDVPPDHWAYADIMEAANSGLTAGYEDGGFHPEDHVTYVEFAALLARAFYGSSTQSASNPWYQTYLDAISGDGVLVGTAASNNLEANIPRYDMAMMMYRIISARGKLPGSSDRQAAQKKLSDWSAIPSSYGDAVASCFAAGLLNGMPDGSFSGSQAMERAQACTVISRLRKYLGSGTADPTASLRAELVKLINAERAKSKLSALTASGQLDGAAQVLIGEIAQGYYGDRPDGTPWYSAIMEAGFPLSEGDSVVQIPIDKSATAAEAVAYMKSKPEMWEQALSGVYTHIGVGYLKSSEKFENVWTLVLVQSSTSSNTVKPEEFTAKLTELLNAERTKAGLKPLESLDKLTQAAAIRAEDLSGGYLEIRANGKDWASVGEDVGLTGYVHESMVVGKSTAAEALQIVLNTAEAKAALLSDQYTYLGVGYVRDENGYGGYKDFCSLLYLTGGNSPSTPSTPSTSNTPSTPSGSFTPVPIDELANRKSVQKKASDEQFAQAYAAAVKLVEPYANLSREEQLQGICKDIRAMFDAGMDYSMTAAHYDDPYGYFILGAASCAGCTRATGLCLNILGIPYEHVNENEYSHQWCRVNINGTYWICDPYGLTCGPEPAPYKHPYF